MANYKHDRKIPESPLVPYPSGAFLPERDIEHMPVLEAHHLGIDFGGLTAVDDFSLTVGRTEIAGLIGPNGAGKHRLQSADQRLPTYPRRDHD